MKILQAAGYGPELDVCISCNQSRKDEDMLVSPPWRRPVPLLQTSGSAGNGDLAQNAEAAPVWTAGFKTAGQCGCEGRNEGRAQKVMRALMDICAFEIAEFLDQMDKYNI